MRRAMNVILQGDGAPTASWKWIADPRASSASTTSRSCRVPQTSGHGHRAATQERRLKEALEHQQVLVKEINHRVKNSLQLVSSMLNLQAGADPRGCRALAGCIEPDCCYFSGT